MAPQDVSHFDLNSDDDSICDRLQLHIRPPTQIERRDTENILTQPASSLITRKKVEHCVQNYERSAPVQDRLNIAKTPRRLVRQVWERGK